MSQQHEWTYGSSKLKGSRWNWMQSLQWAMTMTCQGEVDWPPASRCSDNPRKHLWNTCHLYVTNPDLVPILEDSGNGDQKDFLLYIMSQWHFPALSSECVTEELSQEPSSEHTWDTFTVLLDLDHAADALSFLCWGPARSWCWGRYEVITSTSPTSVHFSHMIKEHHSPIFCLFVWNSLPLF